MAPIMDLPTITATTVEPIPDWALRQRRLFALMDEAAPLYQARYTRSDGTFVWRQEWPGMDGSDDGYESYGNWPLYYALGGSTDIHERSRFLWEAVTRQFTEYGQVWREFDAYYDWMHHGESYTYTYSFGLADPIREPDRGRAQRFAHMYTGDDPEAPNWDAAKRMIRSPITGSKGPRFKNSWDDWSTHRWVLSDYPIPFEDLDLPTRSETWREGEIVEKADWNDDAVYGKILQALNERQMRCDVPLNLTSTSLITHAYMLTGEDAYRTWVLDYLEAWEGHIDANGGTCPDNVGPSGKIGETLDGKWWGGYYGWRWPHGFTTIIEPLTIAAMNAVLLTGDMGYLDIPRSQLQRLMDLGRVEDGQRLVPYRHTDAGWTSFRPLAPHHICQIWYMSQDPKDREWIEDFPQSRNEWLAVAPGRGKGDDIHFGPWYSYLDKRHADYPQLIMDAQEAEILRRMEVMRRDDGDPESWDVHHWQEINPVHTEALLQLACGGPQIIYHGGLLHVRLRYFDALEGRPGLPADVAALVSSISEAGVTVQFVNTSPLHGRRLIAQAGAFGEHRITKAASAEEQVKVEGRHLAIDLPPGRSIRIALEMKRYCHQPNYNQPL